MAIGSGFTIDQDGNMVTKQQDAGTPEEIARANNFLQVQAANEQLANSQTPQEVQRSNFSVPVTEGVTSADLSTPATLDEVRAFRNNRQAQEEAVRGLDDINPDRQVSVFDDPESFITSTLFGDREPTRAEQQAADIRARLTETTGDISDDLTEARTRAEETTGISALQSNLAETNEKIAARTARFRRELRAYEADAERRGVSRAFFQDGRNKLEADATAELADLYIIQNAQSGNLEAARSYIDTAVNNRYRAIEIELAQEQARLNELMPTLEAEEKQRAQALQLAITERQQNIEFERQDAATKRELALQAAANGASSATISQITNAGSVDTALATATPFIGLLERQAAERAASSAALARRKSLVDLALMGDEDAMQQLGPLGESIKQQLADAKTTEERQRVEKVIQTGYEIQNNLEIAERIANSPAFDAATGSIQNQWWVQVGGSAAAGTGAGAAGGSFIPGLGTVAGGAAGFIGGTIGGVINYNRVERAKEDLFNDIEAITSQRTLKTLIDAKDDGATFGALSQTELDILIQASSELAAAIEYEPGTSNIRGLSGSPADVQRRMNQVVTLYQKARDDNARNVLDDGEKNQLYSVMQE